MLGSLSREKFFNLCGVSDLDVVKTRKEIAVRLERHLDYLHSRANLTLTCFLVGFNCNINKSSYKATSFSDKQGYLLPFIN